MSIKDRTSIKTYFENGDVPTESDFSDFIDSTAFLSGDNTSVGNWDISGNITIEGDLSANNINLSNSTVVGSVTSTGMWLTLTINNSALAVPLYTY